MKKHLVFFFIFLFFSKAYAQEKIVWDYPIKPGMKEWVAFEKWEQMVNACQIPVDILNTMDTKELVTVCKNYPLLNSYMAFNDERIGVNVIIKQFNGLQELCQRKDGVRELIIAYADYPVLSQVQKDVNSKDYRIPYNLSFVELVLTDEIFLNQMSGEELEKTRKIAVDKYADKLQYSDVYSLFSIKKSMLLIAVIGNKQGQTGKSNEIREVINNFIQEYNNLSDNTLTEMSKIITK